MPLDHFNLVAGIYDRYGQFVPGRLLAGVLSLSKENHLLDVGGGTGRVAAILRDHVKEVYIVDTSFGMLRHSVAKKIPTICAQAESIPIPTGSFDRVIMVDAFHHVVNQHSTARELFRVLTPGGRAIIVEPNIHLPTVKLIALAEKLLLMRSRILPGERIGALFEGLEGRISIHYEENNVIVVVEKAGSQD
jgi:ubiquinone/menaquinone biosynthesis C-methylase UbiE